MADEVISPAPTPAAEPTPAPAPAPTPAADPIEQVQQSEAADELAFVEKFFEPLNADLEDEPEAALPSPAPAQPPEAATPALEAVKPPEAPPAQPVTTPAVSPVPTPATLPTPATTPAQAQVVAQPAAPQPPGSPPSAAVAPPSAPAAGEPVGNGFDQIAEGLVKQKQDFINALAEHQYKLSDQELDELMSDPKVGYAKLAARAQVEATASVLKVLSQQMPVYVSGLMQARIENQQREDRFWNENPTLDRTKHKGTVAEVMKTVRQLNPQMDSETFIKTVGAISAGLVGAPAAQPRAAVPTGQVVQTPGPVVRQAVPGGFIPAGPSAAPASAHPKPQLTEAERFFEMFRLDESGAFES